jgi:hypothetical protein
MLGQPIKFTIEYQVEFRIRLWPPSARIKFGQNRLIKESISTQKGERRIKTILHQLFNPPALGFSVL